MRRIVILISLLLLFFRTFSQNEVKCLISTSFGNIEINLYPEKAPLTVANFLEYVDQKLYDNTTFFRVCTPENENDRKIRIEVIQGGDVPDNLQFDPIAIETTEITGIHHLDGTISMARDTPNSATSSFFICIGNQPELDFKGKRNPDGQGFAAFGRVSRGMKTVRRIQVQEETKQLLVHPVLINSIRRIP